MHNELNCSKEKSKTYTSVSAVNSQSTNQPYTRVITDSRIDKAVSGIYMCSVTHQTGKQESKTQRNQCSTCTQQRVW